MKPRALGTAPIWFSILVTGLAAAAAHALELHTLEQPTVYHSWFMFLIPIASWIWRGLEVVGRVTLKALAYSVHLLWNFAREIGDGIKGFGRQFLSGMRGAWRFLRATYSNVLRPAGQKLWHFVEWAKAGLEQIFKPVIDFLLTVRSEILKFYDRFVRPILDTIGLARQALRMLGALGVDWAKALDVKLANLEEQIDRPFRYLLQQLNRVIGIIDRIMTADGLFQRLAFMKTYVRDFRYVVSTWHNMMSRPLTERDRLSALERDNYPTGQEIMQQSALQVRTGEGPHRASLEERYLNIRINLGRR